MSRHTLVLDAGVTHYSLLKGVDVGSVATLKVGASPSSGDISPRESSGIVPHVRRDDQKGKVTGEGNKKAKNNGGVWIDPRGIGKGPIRSSGPSSLSPELFKELVLHHLRRYRGGREELGGG